MMARISQCIRIKQENVESQKLKERKKKCFEKEVLVIFLAYC